MKVASVGFHWGVSQVGGGQVPSVAFHDWCNILGHECDILNFSKSGKPSTGLVTNHLQTKSFDVKTFKLKDMIKVLNTYDFVFFGTPGPAKSEDFPDEETWSSIKVPYVVMIHAEFDNTRLYDPKRIRFMLDHPHCQSLAVIDYTFNYWKSLTSKKQIFWHPCTLPSYLVGPSHESSVQPDAGDGLVYAARLETWKNPELLARLTLVPDFMGIVNRVDVYGTTNVWHIEEKINSHQPDWKRHTSTHLIYDRDASLKKFESSRYFWDVCGNTRYQLPIKRLNLAAYEAMKGGCIVLADHRYVQPYCREFTINVNRDQLKSDLDAGKVPDIVHDLREVDRDYVSVRDGFIKKVSSSPVGYDAMKQQVIEILSI